MTDALQMYTAAIFGPVLIFAIAAGLVGFAMLLIASAIRGRIDG